MRRGLIGLPGLEKLRAVTAALQAAESVRFAQSQVAEQLAADTYPTAIGRGIAEQIGLACRISPVTAARRVNTARALWFELPDTYSQLTAGELSARVAETIVCETRHLDADIEAGGCERGNDVREMPGWRISLIDCGFHSGPHTIHITTPTGHHYLSRAPDPLMRTEASEEPDRIDDVGQD
jgi:hypothetical protein